MACTEVVCISYFRYIHMHDGHSGSQNWPKKPDVYMMIMLIVLPVFSLKGEGSKTSCNHTKLECKTNDRNSWHHWTHGIVHGN